MCPQAARRPFSAVFETIHGHRTGPFQAKSSYATATKLTTQVHFAPGLNFGEAQVALDVTLDELLGNAAPTSVRRTARKREDLPQGLLELQEEAGLTDEDVQMLAQVNFRGHRPRDMEGWRFLLEALRMLSQRPNQK